jgi:hypothetical protein
LSSVIATPRLALTGVAAKTLTSTESASLAPPGSPRSEAWIEATFVRVAPPVPAFTVAVSIRDALSEAAIVPTVQSFVPVA